MRDELTIGELAGRCGVSRDTLRFYERERLLPAPRRSPSGYRLYTPGDEARVRFVRQAQAIGLSLEDVRELLELRRLRSPRECARVAARLRARIGHIDARIEELQVFRRRLARNLRRCEATTDGECPIVLDLAGSDPARSPGPSAANGPPLRGRRNRT